MEKKKSTTQLSNLSLWTNKQFLHSKMFSKTVHSFPNDHHPCSSSAVTIASSTDIMREILLCLPVKSLLVFKIVSKRWLSLISDPHFVSNHSLKHPPKTMGLFLDKFSFLIPRFEFISLDKLMNSSSPFKSLSFVNDAAGIKIEHSCNGLLCCSSFRANNTKRMYYVYNPSTTQYTSLPLSPSRVVLHDSVPVCSVSLAFDPLKSPHYKAICILNTDTDTYRIEIYSSETASWKVSGYANSGCEDLFTKSGVFWNGSLHWISLKETSQYIDAEQIWMCLRESSMLLDIDREVVKTLRIPPIRDQSMDKRRIGYFGECRGHMHLIEISSIKPTWFDILEMETDYSMWNVKYRVNLNPVLKTVYPEIFPLFCFGENPEIFMHRHNDVLDPFPFYILLVDDNGGTSSSLVLRISNSIVSYNLKKKKFKKIRDLARNHDSKGIVRNIWLDVYQYIGTLTHV